ncbi:MAG: glycosyltransferase family 4 protein [Bryobacteraceae bacterium]
MHPKLVRVLTRLGAGGPPIHAVLLTREMKQYGYQSILVAGRCADQDGDMSYLLGADDAVHWVEEMSRSIAPWQDIQALFRLYRYLRAERPSIVHTHTAKAGLLGRLAARLAGVPVVVHTFHGNVLNHYFCAPVNWAIRSLERFLAHFTDCICVLSPQQAHEMTDRYHIASREKVRIVPLGMDLEPFRTLDSPSHEGKLTVGWLGRLVAIKNVPLLLEVIRKTVRSTDLVQFLVAGDGPEYAPLASLAQELGPARLRWLGWQQDIRPVIAQCHLLMQTSRNEGTPVALIQGMAAGRPFLSTPAGGVVDMTTGLPRREEGGCKWFDNAVLATPRAESFVTALCRLAEDREELARMGQAAAEYANRRFTLEALLDSMNGLYSELLHKKASAISLGYATSR